MTTLLTNFWQLFMVSAPWLLLGLFIAALLNVYLPKDFLNKHLGKEGFWTTVKAALIGAPMPLCSCGVIPAAIGLRRAGASKSATTAFLVSTPETGIDSISVSYVLLGPFMAVIRPIAAVASAITAGLLVGKESKQAPHNPEHSHSHNETTACCAPKSEQQPKAASCCGSRSAKIVAIVEPETEAKTKQSSCCASTSKQEALSTTEVNSCCAPKTDVKPKKTSCCVSQNEPMVSEVEPETQQSSCCNTGEAVQKESQWAKLKQAFHFSATKLLQDTAVWLLIGLFFAALIQTYVPEGFLAQWGTGLLAMTVMVLVSIPMYICATASTPIAAGLLLSGVSPGAVLVFMLAGPATNIATLGVVGKELGKRALAAYLTGVIGMALVFGYLTDYLVAEYGFVVAPTITHGHEVLPYWLEFGAAFLLAGLLVRLLAIWLKSTFKPSM